MRRLRGSKVKSSNLFCILLFSALVLLGCTEAVRVQEAPPKQEKPPAVPKEEQRPKKPPVILPDYSDLPLQILSIHRLEKSGGAYNSYNPQISPDERWVACEVNHEMLKKIFIYEIDVEGLLRSGEEGGIASGSKETFFNKTKEVYLEERIGETFTEDLFETSLQESFNYEFSWFPNSSAFIFTSNAGLGEYNLFIGALDENDRVLGNITRMIETKRFGTYHMMTREIRKDGQARVSPDGRMIVFTSGRTGNGDLYSLDLESGALKRLTTTEETDLFGQWSPDGNDIVYTTGGKHSHDIHVIRGVKSDAPVDEVLVKWFFDDVMPVYSPDGKWIAFYTTYNSERDPFNTKRWGVMIIPADGSAPSSGNELVDYFHISDVIKDHGAAWFPDSSHIIFAKNIDTDYNPIYIYNIEKKEQRLVETGTDINHDIMVSVHGLVSFRAQVLGWDRIFIAPTTYFKEYFELNS
jgi:Tol biopolymer transport system component